jgi:hypothetical protein
VAGACEQYYSAVSATIYQDIDFSFFLNGIVALGPVYQK